MREIKFRAWRVDGKEMVFMEDYDCDWIFWKNRELDDVVMQYTGLKDKNGKEIYEGDVVSDFNGEHGGVVFDNGVFQICWDGGFPGYPFLMRTNEVIGNIHENPELEVI